jgi:hypothetical protein
MRLQVIDADDCVPIHDTSRPTRVTKYTNPEISTLIWQTPSATKDIVLIPLFYELAMGV